MTMLDTTHNLLGSSSPFTAPSIAATMAENMFQALFLVWIRSEITTQEMWLEFSRKVASLTQWKATVDEWKARFPLFSLSFLHLVSPQLNLSKRLLGQNYPTHVHFDRSLL